MRGCERGYEREGVMEGERVWGREEYRESEVEGETKKRV